MKLTEVISFPSQYNMAQPANDRVEVVVVDHIIERMPNRNF
jgi:hypothetical protein